MVEVYLGPHLIDVKEMEQILRRRLTFDELNRLEEMSRLPRRSSHHDALPESELDRQKAEELQKLPIHRLLKDLDDDSAQRQLDQVQDELVKRSSNDQRMERDSSVDSSSSKSMEPSPLTTDDSSPRRSSRSEPIKAFEHLPRLVEHIAEREYIEDATIVTEAMDQRNLSFLTADKSNWVSDLRRTSLPRLPPIQESAVMHPREDLYLGWTLFKGAERQELGLREVKPRMVQVKHRAKTFVVGIPEEYADARSRSKESRTIDQEQWMFGWRYR